MKENDAIKDLFSNKLENFEARVDPKLWKSISAKVSSGITSGSVTFGVSIFSKVILTVSVTSLIIVGIVVVQMNSQDNETGKESKKNVQVVEDKLDSKSSVDDSDKEIVEDEHSSTNLISSKGTTENSSKPDVGVVVQENYENDNDLFLMVDDDFLPVEAKDINASNSVVKEQKVENKKEKIEEEVKDELILSQSVKEEAKGNNQADPVSMEKEERLYFIGELSNIFTPNGDGNNDFLFIESEGLSDFSLVVMEAKTNAIVYKTQDPGFQWDGIGLNGQPVEDGKYVYFLTASDPNGNPVNRYSNLYIKRQR